LSLPKVHKTGKTGCVFVVKDALVLALPFLVNSTHENAYRWKVINSQGDGFMFIFQERMKKHLEGELLGFCSPF
jgi:hypothetical protein